MKRMRTDGLSLTAISPGKPKDLRHALACLIMACAVAAGLCVQFCAACESLAGSVMVMIGVACAVCLTLCALYALGFELWGMVGWGILLLVWIGVYYADAWAGLCALANDFLDFLATKTGRIHLDIAAADAEEVLYAALPLAAVTALLTTAAAWNGSAFYALFPLILCVTGTAGGFLPASWGFCLVLLGTILLLSAQVWRENRSSARRGGLLGVLPILLLAAALAMGGAIPLEEGASDAAAALRKGTGRTLHELLYDKETNSMPEGRLKNLGAWNKSNALALALVMSAPEKLYLKGFVGEHYTAMAWEALDNEKLADYKDLFYWLHRDGLYGQSVLGSAMAATGHMQTASLSVENLSACSACLYLPYALHGTELLDSLRIGDADARSGDKSYSVSLYPGSLAEWYACQARLAQTQTEAAQRYYLLREQAYKEFVYAVYTDVPEESLPALNRALGTKSRAMTLSEIRAAILNWLSENLSYNEDVATHNGAEDFISYVLEKSPMGYSVHYASIAAVMLRYFGVPARYVEGYYLPPEEADGIGAEGTVFLDENHAHAWAEYYLDGVGWIPFETTPGYIDENELLLGVSDGGGRTYEFPQEHIAPVIQPDETQEDGGKKNTFFVPGYIWYIILGIALLAMLVLIIYRRKKLRLALGGIEKQENRQAVASWCAYAALLRHRAGFEEPAEDEPAALLRREAVFSNHHMTDAQRGQAADYARQILAACKEKWGFLRRLYYRWLICLYL